MGILLTMKFKARTDEMAFTLAFELEITAGVSR